MIILLLLSATGHAWPHQPVDTAKLAGLAKLAGALVGGGGENEVVKAHQSEGGWRLVSKAEKGKAGRGWGLKDGLLAGNPPQVFGRPQQNHGGQVAKFQQAAIGGGGTFGSASEQGRDFNLLSAFEQFVEGSQGAGKYGGKTGREEERKTHVPENENKRKEREESRQRVEDSLSKFLSTSRTETNARKDGEREETNVEGSGAAAVEGGEKQRKSSVGEKQEGSSEEEMLRQVVGSLKKSISKESNKDLQNRTTLNSSPPPLLAQTVVTPHIGENPVPFVGKNSISEEGNSVSVAEIGGGKIKDKNGAATEFPQTEMGSREEEEEEEAGGSKKTTKTENIGSDLNGVPTAKGPRREDRGLLEQPMALTKRSEEESIHSMPNSPWLLPTALALALVCILAVLGLGCHLHGPRSCPAPGSKSPFSDLSPTFQSAKLAFSKTPPEERPTSGGRIEGLSNGLINGTVTGSRAHKFAEWEGRNRPAGTVAVTEHLVDVASGDAEEEDNDMVYECPGLAPHGEMVVTNPFFMSQELSVERGKVAKAPCPVNVNNNMRHGSINRNLR